MLSFFVISWKLLVCSRRRKFIKIEIIMQKQDVHGITVGCLKVRNYKFFLFQFFNCDLILGHSHRWKNNQ